MNTTDVTEADFHIFAGVALSIVSPIGVAANAYVFLSVIRRRKTRSSFLCLCASKALFNFVICTVFLIWCSPTAFLRAYYLPSVVGVILGNIVGGMIYTGGVLTQVLASVNRLIASFSIHAYNRFCTLRNTMILVVICWIGTFTLAVVYFFNGVGYVFHAELLVWQGDGEASAIAFANVGVIIYSCTGIMFILNIITFGKLILITKSNAVLSNTESTKRMKRNRILLAQKVSQDSLYLVDMLFAQVVSGLLPYNWWQFVCFSFVWLSLNTIDGIVMILFVKELSDPLRRQFQRALRFLINPSDHQTELFRRRKSKMTMATSSANQ